MQDVGQYAYRALRADDLFCGLCTLICYTGSACEASIDLLRAAARLLSRLTYASGLGLANLLVGSGWALWAWTRARIVSARSDGTGDRPSSHAAIVF